jgi:hypothetical protein
LNCLSAFIAKGNEAISLRRYLIVFKDCFVFKRRPAGETKEPVETNTAL